MHSVCDSVMPANHATFASEKRSFTKEGREGFDRDDQSPGLPSTSQSIGASLKRVVFDRYCDENGTSNNRLKPGRVVLALFDLNLFEDDSCDAESVGKLITDEVTDGDGNPMDVSFVRFDSIVEILRRRNASGKKAITALPSLVPPELFLNESLQKVFRARAGMVVNSDGSYSHLMSMSQWLGLLKDADLLDERGSPAGASVLFSRARSDGDNTSNKAAHDYALPFANSFIAAIGLVATMKGVSIESIIGQMVLTSKPLSDAIGDLRKCFALLDSKRDGFIKVDDLPNVLCAGGFLNHLSLEDGHAFLFNRVEGLAKSKGSIAPIDQFPGIVTLQECERHAEAARRVPKSKVTKSRESFSQLDSKPTTLHSEVSYVFHRFCCAGVEAGFETEPHPKLMDKVRFEKFLTSVPNVFDEKFSTGAGAISFARAANGSLRLDEAKFFTALRLIAHSKEIDISNLFEHVKRSKLSVLSTVSNVGGNDAYLAYDTFETLDGAITTNETNNSNRKQVPRRAMPLDPGVIRAADPTLASRIIDHCTPAPSSHLALIAADVGGLDGLSLTSAGAAIEGARITFANDIVHKDDVVRVLAMLADIRDDKLSYDELSYNSSEKKVQVPPTPTLDMYSSDARLQSVFREWSAFGSSDPEGVRRKINASWERSVADARASRTNELLSYSSSHTKKENLNPLNSAPPCSRHNLLESDDDGRVRFTTNPVQSNGMDWTDECQLLGRHDTSGLDRARRMRVPDARFIGFSSAHVSRVAAAETTRRAMEGEKNDNNAMALPSLGTAGRNEGKWEEIHGRIGVGDKSTGENTSNSIATLGASARAAASMATALDANRYERRKGMSHEALAEDEVYHRGSSALALERAAALASTARQGAAVQSKAYLPSNAPNSLRAGISMEQFRKLVVQAGLTGPQLKNKSKNYRLTPAAADVAFALSRAPDSNEMTWGEFLNAVGRIGHDLEMTFGDVALRLRAVGAPKPERRGPPKERVTFVPAPERQKKKKIVFDVDAFARACDDAHVLVVESVWANSHVESLERHRLSVSPERSEETHVVVPTEAFEESLEKESLLMEDPYSRRKETLASTLASTRRFDTTQSPSPTLEPETLTSTWRVDTSRLDMGTSLVASLRASAFYERGANKGREK